jgi:hypothetical protein
MGERFGHFKHSHVKRRVKGSATYGCLFEYTHFSQETEERFAQLCVDDMIGA